MRHIVPERHFALLQASDHVLAEHRGPDGRDAARVVLQNAWCFVCLSAARRASMVVPTHKCSHGVQTRS